MQPPYIMPVPGMAIAGGVECVTQRDVRSAHAGCVTQFSAPAAPVLWQATCSFALHTVRNGMLPHDCYAQFVLSPSRHTSPIFDARFDVGVERRQT
jgi:hypothetical protein